MCEHLRLGVELIVATTVTLTITIGKVIHNLHFLKHLYTKYEGSNSNTSNTLTIKDILKMGQSHLFVNFVFLPLVLVMYIKLIMRPFADLRTSPVFSKDAFACISNMKSPDQKHIVYILLPKY